MALIMVACSLLLSKSSAVHMRVSSVAGGSKRSCRKTQSPSPRTFCLLQCPASHLLGKSNFVDSLEDGVMPDGSEQSRTGPS